MRRRLACFALATAALAPGSAQAAFDSAGVEGGVFTPKAPALATGTPMASPSPDMGAIDIRTRSDAGYMRTKLIRYLWKQDNFPLNVLPAKVTTGITDPDFSPMASVASIDRLDVTQEFGIKTYEYLLHARNPINKLMIYHSGHEGTFRVHKAEIQYFLDRGYDVLGVSMPLIRDSHSGWDYPTPHLRDFGNVTLYTHEYLPLVESSTYSPMKLFFEPVAEGLNYALKQQGYSQVAMMGLSGGGWTTTVYAALDVRVRRAYPIAGTLPLYMHYTYNPGDWEQVERSFYHVADYLELYIMGVSHGLRRHELQILNSRDPSSFSGAIYQSAPYEPVIDDRIRTAGIDGTFDVYIDPNAQHSISPNALNVIANDLAQG